MLHSQNVFTRVLESITTPTCQVLIFAFAGFHLIQSALPMVTTEALILLYNRKVSKVKYVFCNDPEICDNDWDKRPSTHHRWKHCSNCFLLLFL